MSKQITKNDIELLQRLSKLSVNEIDKIELARFTNKIKTIYENQVKRSKVAISSILDKRVEDKWYGRESTVIQNHFNATVRRIQKLLNNNKGVEACKLYKEMLDEVGTRYCEYYDNAIRGLSSEELEYLCK